MSTNNGAEENNGVQNGTVTDTVAKIEDDVFTTELVSEHEHEHRQPNRGELRPLEYHGDHNRTNRSPLASPVRQKLTPSLPTLLEGQ